MSNLKLYLASASPRRASLLEQAGYTFTVKENNIINEVISAPLPYGVELLALEKARSGVAGLDNCVVLAADTVVVCGDKILGKPDSIDEATDMLRILSGNSHEVITGVALIQAGNNNKEITFYDNTRVWMRTLHDDEIWSYVNSGDSMDKAGSYAIQGFAAVFISKIEGCYYNVVGLPLPKVYLNLRDLGVLPFPLKPVGMTR